MRLRHLSTLCICGLVLLLLPPPAVSQDLGGGGSGGRIEGRYKIIPLPYLNYNRSLGFTLGALPMVMFNPVAQDTLSPSSVGGALGMYTTNDTWAVMGFTQMFFAEDKWRVTAAGGRGSINFQFYLDNPVDVWVPYNTAADFAYLELQRLVVKRIYAGVSYVYTHFRNKTELYPIESQVTLHGAGLKATMDTRSNVYYPKSGFFTNAAYFAYPKAFGNEVTSNTLELDYNHYWPFRKDEDVLAARAFAGLGIGDLSFNQQYIIGRVDIRGYTQGAFRGNYLLAAQAEYRWNFWGRWGAVGFFGLATVFDAINESHNGKILPGLGTGIRFTAFKENHMNVGLDIAVGDDDWGMYFRIGEAL